MPQMKIEQGNKYHSFPSAEFFSPCTVCNTPLRFETDLYILPSDKNTESARTVEVHTLI